MDKINTITEKEAFCFFRSISGFADSSINKLKDHFATYRDAAIASVSEYEDIISDKEIQIISGKRDKEGIKAAYDALLKRGIEVHLPLDDSYPARLRDIPASPKALFSLGKLPDPKLPSVAIIGARNCSAYGADMTREFAKELARQGVQIISGMARGIDGIAQATALDNGGYSCGVLGCGVDICYPKSNKEIYNGLINNGGLISEYYPGTNPLSQFFPARNRIISGLCDALLVIEAKAKSGTLITVSMALDQGREIYALPGRVTDALSYGCNMLIRDGAIPLISPVDFTRSFLEHFGYTYDNKPANQDISNRKLPSMDLTKEEKAVIMALDYNPKSINEIFASVCKHSNISIPQLMTILLDLLVKNQISCIDGANYYLSSM